MPIHHSIWRVATPPSPLREEEVTALSVGVSVAIPRATACQFRNDGPTTLEIVAVAMPPWPGDSEACAAEGAWPPAV